MIAALPILEALSPVELAWAAAAPRALHVAALGLLVWPLDRVLRGVGHAPLCGALWGLVVLAACVPAGLVPPGAGPGVPAEALAAVVRPPAWAAAAALLWAAGAVLAAARWARAERRLGRELAGYRPAPDGVVALADPLARRLGLRAAPPLLVDPCAGTAMVTGVVRPRIVLPGARLADPAWLRCALAHELAHVARRHPGRAALVRVVRILWWFHPALACAEARLRELRELDADAHAVAALGDGAVDAYRAALLESARGWIRGGATTALAFLTPPAALLLRLRALDRCGVRTGARRRAAVVFVLLAWACVPIRGPSPPRPADLDGCLQLRFQVFGALGAARQQTPSR